LTYYTAAGSSAGVFATGTNWWVSKLSQDCPDDATYTCPKEAVVTITTNVLDAFGVGPAGLAHPSLGTNVKDLPKGVPDTTYTSDTVTPRRRTTRTTYYYPQYQTRATSPPATSAPAYIYTPPTYRYTPPTTRPRGLLGR